MTGKVEAYVNKDSHQRVPKKTSRERGSVPVSPLTLSCTSHRSPRSRSREEWWPGVSILYYFRIIKLIKKTPLILQNTPIWSRNRPLSPDFHHFFIKKTQFLEIIDTTGGRSYSDTFPSRSELWSRSIMSCGTVSCGTVDQINYDNNASVCRAHTRPSPSLLAAADDCQRR